MKRSKQEEKPITNGSLPTFSTANAERITRIGPELKEGEFYVIRAEKGDRTLYVSPQSTPKLFALVPTIAKARHWDIRPGEEYTEELQKWGYSTKIEIAREEKKLDMRIKANRIAAGLVSGAAVEPAKPKLDMRLKANRIAAGLAPPSDSKPKPPKLDMRLKANRIAAGLSPVTSEPKCRHCKHEVMTKGSSRELIAVCCFCGEVLPPVYGNHGTKVPIIS